MLAAAIRRPVTVTVGVVLICMFGFLSISGLPIQLTPDVTVPTITVSTAWPGATPTEIESDIIEQQESALKSLEGLERMTSSMRRNQGSVTLELEVGASLEAALVRVTNLLSQVGGYPESAREPTIQTADSSGPPLAVVVVQALDGTNVDGYRTWFEDRILPQLTRVEGVAGITLFGGRDTEVHIDFDPNALAASKISVGALAEKIRSNLTDRSAGDISMGKRRLSVRVGLKPVKLEALEQLVIKTEGDTSILLGQVAKVSLSLRKQAAIGIADGKPSLAMLFFRKAGFNVLEVTREIRAKVAELSAGPLAIEGLTMQVVSDQVEYIEGALDLVAQNLLLGGALAILVLLLFLRSIGASLVVAVSIPVSMVGTVLGMSLLGRTVNIVSLAGMAFAVGMVVDNSIVVLENIDVWRRKTANVKRAALEGVREVWGAIFASTVTTAAVFIPIISWQDEVGELLRDVAIALTVSVGVSLVVSVLVIPSFSAKLLRSKKKAGEADETDYRSETVTSSLGRQIRWITRSPLRSVGLAAVGLGVTVSLAVMLVPPLEYLPTGNRDLVFGIVLPPPGYSVEELKVIGAEVNADLVAHTGVEKDGEPAIARSFFFGSPDSVFMGAVAQNPDEVDRVAALVRKIQGKIPDSFGFASKASLFGRSIGGGRSIDIDITGADTSKTLPLAGQMMGMLYGAFPGGQVRPIPGLDAGAPEMLITPNRARADALGVAPQELALLIDAYVDGAIIDELGAAGEPKKDVVLKAMNTQIRDAASLKATPVATRSGMVLPLAELINIRETLGPSVIQHIERERAITLQVSPPDDIPLEVAIAKIKNEIVGGLQARGSIPTGVSLAYTGSAGKLEEATERFGFVLILAVIISYLLLSALFEDFLAPLAILVSVPLAGAGGILGLLAVDAGLGPQPLDMMTAIGFVILIGVVVNNAILVVDGALTRMRTGVVLSDALGLAVQRRIRPIFMSALTSLAGLLPLVLFPGAGSELYRGVGAIVLGGLALSTILTIYLVPAMFAALWRLRALFSDVPLAKDQPSELAA
ncbi:MAG: HAE1 family hydrophobic/amphiphilic exporter-1 [Myxococcota bacterium]